MLAAVVDFPHFAVSCNDWLAHIINVVFTHNSDSLLANFSEVLYHPLQGYPLSNRYFGIAMLDFNDYVCLILILNQTIYVCWVYPVVKFQPLEVDKLPHAVWILDFALHCVVLTGGLTQDVPLAALRPLTERPAPAELRYISIGTNYSCTATPLRGIRPQVYRSLQKPIYLHFGMR